MAQNTNAPYSGEVDYGTVDGSAPGTVVSGGTYQVDPQVQSTDGIGMQRVSHRSYYTGRVNYQVTHPVLARLNNMIRASATNSCATSSTCIAGNQDGEWTFATCQPSGFTAQMGIGQALTANLGYWGIPAQSATGAAQAAGSGVAAEATRCAVTVDDVDYYVQTWALTLNTNPYWFSAQNHSTASSAPTSVKVGIQEVNLRLGCAKQILDAAADFTADIHDADIDVVIACVDADDAAIITFTLSDLGTPVEAGSYQVGGLQVWDYAFPACKQLGVLTIT